MGRGRAQSVKCSGCSEKVPKKDAIVADKPIFSYRDDTMGVRYSAGFSKHYYCRNCAKRFHLINSKFRRIGGKRIGQRGRR